MRATAFLALAAVATKAEAYSGRNGAGPQTFNSSLDMRIDPSTVLANTRSYWCAGQAHGCKRLCSNATMTNECSTDTLEYDCRCAANKSAPALKYYDKTMPTFICKALHGQCETYYRERFDIEGMQACMDNILTHCNGTVVIPYDGGKKKKKKKKPSNSTTNSTSAPATETTTMTTMTTVTTTTMEELMARSA